MSGYPYTDEVYEEDGEFYHTLPCPKCGADVAWENDCPGWRSGTNADGTPRISVCFPCGNAALWFCKNRWSDDTECDWEYRIPNRRSSLQDAICPDWMYDPTY